MNEQPKKRTNPFDRPLTTEIETAEVAQPTYVEKVTEEPIYAEPTPSYVYQQPTPQPQRQPRHQTKTQYIQQQDAPKDKYTATMDVALRRKVKIYCATNGKMFSEFIEDACREKLYREGIK